jgi:hypothetical protein
VWKNALMQVVRMRVYLAKARDFLDGMKLSSELAESECRASSALLAVHSAISYGDALWVGLGQKETAAQGHKSRAPRLKKLLNERSYPRQQGLMHLERLLGYKTNVAYSDTSVTEKQVKVMIDHALRFSTWANTVGSELKIEGWRDDESN